MSQDSGVDTNEVRLVGRVSAEPETRTLPSGDELVTLRLVVRRPDADAGPTRVDTFDCAAWSARARRSATGWRAGDVVEIGGRLRRRFYVAGAGKASRVEVEVLRGRLIRRATTGTARRAVVSAGTTSP